MATSTCTLNGIKYNSASGKYGNWANFSYNTSGAMYAGWAGGEGLDCAMVFKITVPSFSGISSSFSITMGLQNQVDNGGPTTLNWSLATTDSYVTGNKYADGVNYPLTNNGEFDSGTVSLNFRYGSYTPYTLTFNTSKITSGGTYYLILYRYDKTGISTQYPTNITLNYKNTYTVSYNANGGSGAPSAQTKVEGTTLVLSSTKPTRANASAGSFTVTFNANGGSVSPTSASAARTTTYTFSKWNTAANGTGTSYNAGGSYTANAGATLYAQWNSSTSTASISLPTPTRSGYTFTGWSTSSTATSGSFGSYTPTGNTTLYTTWSQNQITGTVKIWNGSTWVNGTPYIYNGSSWVKAVPYVYNGSTWKIGLG